MIRIVTDSTADIPPGLASELGIEVVPCFIMFGIQSFLDNVTITRDQFYQRLASDPRQPTTAGPGVSMFEETYRRIGQNGDDILSIHISAALSGIYNSARLGGDQAAPQVRVTVYDSYSISMGLGWQVMAAAQAARQGKSLADIIALLDAMQARVYVFAALDTMEFLRRSGRVGWASAIMGQLLNIKPIVRVYQSVVEPVERVRTRTRMVRRLIQLATELGRLESLAILHTAAAAEAEHLKNTMAELTPGQLIPVVEATPTIGVHVGPNGLGLAAVTRP